MTRDPWPCASCGMPRVCRDTPCQTYRWLRIHNDRRTYPKGTR